MSMLVSTYISKHDFKKSFASSEAFSGIAGALWLPIYIMISVNQILTNDINYLLDIKRPS